MLHNRAFRLTAFSHPLRWEIAILNLKGTMALSLRHKDVMEIVRRYSLIRLQNIIGDPLRRHCPSRAVLNHLYLLLSFHHLFPH